MHEGSAVALTRAISPGTLVIEMKLSIRADLPLDHSRGGSRARYVTWMDVEVTEEGESRVVIGTARVALVHVGEIADAHGDLLPALHGTPLEPLADAYFAQGWYKDDYADGAGIDLLYVESVEMSEAHRARNIDLAMVRRLCDTLGSGCQLSVMPYSTAAVAAHWGRLGFSLTTPGRGRGLMHMKLGQRHARVVDANGTGDFEVLPSGVASYRASHS